MRGRAARPPSAPRGGRGAGAPPAPRRATALVRQHGHGEHAGEPFFAGEVEPCINGKTVALGAYFGVDVGSIVDRLLGEGMEVVCIDNLLTGSLANVEHLFGVASGIDSMVIGEPQILTQVRKTFRLADAEGAVGPTLSALFRQAIRVGRRARAERDRRCVCRLPGARSVEAALTETAAADRSRCDGVRAWRVT